MNARSLLKHQNDTSDTNRQKGFSSSLLYHRSMRILWSKVLSSSMSCTLKNVLMFHVLSSSSNVPSFSLQIDATQSSSGATLSPTKLYSITFFIPRESACVQSPKRNLVCVNLLQTLLPTQWQQKMCPKSVINHTRPDLSFPLYIQTFCDLRGTMTAIQFSLWLLLSWVNVFVASKISILNGCHSSFLVYFDSLEGWGIEPNHTPEILVFGSLKSSKLAENSLLIVCYYLDEIFHSQKNRIWTEYWIV